MSNAEIVRARVDKLTEQMRREHSAHGLPLFVAVVCNRCGTIASGDTVEELVPQIRNWKLDVLNSRHQDFCPHCR